MEILVCIKQVPGSNKVEVDPVTGVLKRNGADSKMNPYDLYALECGMKLKEQYGGRVSVITMGPPPAAVVIKEAFAMGADEGALLSDRAFGGADVLATSYTLAQGIKKMGKFDVIICGLQTTDGDTAQVGPEVSVVNGDGRNSDFLYEEGISAYDSFVAVTGNDEVNILACVAARKFGVRRTVAEVENIEYVRLAEEMGVDCVINKKFVTANRIFRLTLSESARYARYMNGIDAEVIEYTASQNSEITTAPLRDIAFPKDALVGGVLAGVEDEVQAEESHYTKPEEVVDFTSKTGVDKSRRAGRQVWQRLQYA